MIDLALAIAHHVLVFSLAGLLAVEFALARAGLAGDGIRRLARVDALYGGVSMAVILVGVCRVLFGLRGWEYYVYYLVFWMKMAAFIGIALLSIMPTLRIAGWRKRLATDAAFAVPASEVGHVQTFLKAEAGVLVLVLAFAAAMARAVGY